MCRHGWKMTHHFEMIHCSEKNWAKVPDCFNCPKWIIKYSYTDWKTGFIVSFSLWIFVELEANCVPCCLLASGHNWDLNFLGCVWICHRIWQVLFLGPHLPWFSLRIYAKRKTSSCHTFKDLQFSGFLGKSLCSSYNKGKSNARWLLSSGDQPWLLAEASCCDISLLAGKRHVEQLGRAGGSSARLRAGGGSRSQPFRAQGWSDLAWNTRSPDCVLGSVLPVNRVNGLGNLPTSLLCSTLRQKLLADPCTDSAKACCSCSHLPNNLLFCWSCLKVFPQ